MSTPELEDLLARHFEGTLDEAGGARLDELLATDPAAFERFRGLAGIHGLLRAREASEADRDRLEAKVARSIVEEDRRRRLTSRVLGTIRNHRPAPTRPWGPILIAAAGGLVAILVVLATRPAPRPTRPEVAVPPAPVEKAVIVEEERPRPRVPEPPRPEPERPLPTPKPVVPEEKRPEPPPPAPEPVKPVEPSKTIPEPPKPRAITRTSLAASPRRGARFTPPGFAVTLERGSSLLLEQEEGGETRATLSAGLAFFEVEKRTAPFVVNLGGAEAVVVGTSFQAERTALAVVEGSVRLRNEKGEVLVRAGQRSTLRAGEKPSAPAKADVEALTAWRRRPELLPNPEGAPFVEREVGASRKLPGLVLASPFGEGEAESEKLARATAERMDVGLVVGRHFRDPAKKTWINVDRGMEAEVRDDGTPAKEAFTDRARKATSEYLDQLRAGAGVGPREAVPMVVQFRTHYEPGLDACEVALSGWNKQTIAGLKALHAQLLEKHKPAARMEMRFQGVDDAYEHKGAKRAFTFTEADARIEGYMAPKNARNAVAFFFKSPGDADARILAEMIEYLYARRR